MKNFKSILALILVAAIMIPMLIACGSSEKDDDKGKGANEYEGTTTSVPADLTFEGETYTVLCREDNTYGEYLYEIIADENETELVNQAVYERNLAVEERFGVDLIAHAVPGSWNESGDFINTFKNSILSGGQAFDLIMGYQAYMCELGLHDLYVNFYEVPYVKDDINKDYFFQDAVKELTVNGKMYFMLGDYSLTFYEYLYVMYFNKQIAENENIEDLYQLVRDGKWTIDKCIELSKGLYRDVNGDGWNGVEDMFGFITDYENTSDAMFSFFDVHATSRDEENNVVLTLIRVKWFRSLKR